MLPTLGQLITPTTDVTVDQDYEIVVLDIDGSRRVIGSEHFGPTATVERTLEGLGPNPIVFWGPHLSHASHITRSA